MTTTISPQQVVLDPGFEQLKRRLIEATGLAYYGDKDEELAIPVARRLAELEIVDCTDYLARLEEGAAGEAELDVVTAALTIGETYFFRHREMFEALRNRVIPELIERNRELRRLRIWSAGCATGAEPYSVAILLENEFQQLLAGWDVSILGTDINRDYLAQAQHGRFLDWHLRSVSQEVTEACFSSSAGSWRIRDQFRRGVSFQYHNLVQHPFPSPVNNLCALDLILCRNVTIYFDAQIVGRLVRQFYDSLVEGGWLLVGHAEPSVELYRQFQSVNVPGAVLYQRQPRPLSSQPEVSPVAATAAALPAAPAASAVGRSGRMPRSAARGSHSGLQPSSAVCSADSSPRGASAPTLAALRAKLDAGDWEAAAEDCRGLAIVARLNPVLHFYQALVAQQLGDHAESELALRRAIYLDRTFVLAHYYLGLVLQRKRDAAAAARSFRNTLALLEHRPHGEIFADADGLSVGALRRLTEMHLEVLQRA